MEQPEDHNEHVPQLPEYAVTLRAMTKDLTPNESTLPSFNVEMMRYLADRQDAKTREIVQQLVTGAIDGYVRSTGDRQQANVRTA
ncbi:MAG: hypothetical protein ABIR91_02040, partial [Candidatus Saccharimonadales bacterium]